MAPIPAVSLCLLSAFIVTACGAWFGGGRGPHRPVTILTYNVQNLFDDSPDETDYPEYNPENGQWTGDLYRERLARTARVIRESVRGGPDIVALQEVENEDVLNSLVETHLAELGYLRPVLFRSAGSAINVGLLTRLPVLDAAAYPVTDCFDPVPTRDILQVSVDCEGATLFLLVCHWKSQAGGAEYTEQLRLRAAGIVQDRLATIRAENAEAEVVVLGDLNESVDEWQSTGMQYQTALTLCDSSLDARSGSLAVSVDLSAARAAYDTGLLFSPWGEAGACGSSTGGSGSYWYNGSWETYDNFLLSAGLLDRDGLTYVDFWVVPNGYLRDGSGHPYGWRLDTGLGYSDHLPLLLVLANNG